MNPLILIAWLACQSFDGISTEMALKRPGAIELNPIMQKGRIPIRLGVNIGALLWAHKSKSKIIPVTMIASGCGAGMWNTFQLQR